MNSSIRLLTLVLLSPVSILYGQTVPVDLSGYDRSCGVQVERQAERLSIRWPAGPKEFGAMVLDLNPGQPLIASLGVAGGEKASVSPLLERVQPVTFLTVGTRVAPSGRPPGMSIWNTFFDKVTDRPYQTHRTQLDLKRARVTSQGRRATVMLGELTAGGFSGELSVTFYAGSPLVHLEAIMATDEDARAIHYDAGLVGTNAGWKGFAWLDTKGQLQRSTSLSSPARPLAVRHRMIAAESESGTVVSFPPPHQFFSPRDFSDNLQYVWFGNGYQKTNEPSGFGIRQSPTGGGNFIPWFNAPPKSRQRLGMFLLLHSGRAEEAFTEALRFTHGDRFPDLPGYVKFTSHYHLAHTVDSMRRKEQGTWSPTWVPEFVQQFKRMGVDAVHVGEFHGDGHPKDPGPLRLPEYEAMFSECQRLSDDRFLLIPGEEINDYLGIKEPGKHPGHWMSLFPKPVYWIELTKPRAADEPFVEPHPKYGKVYRVGSREDMVELLKAERGLAWSAHPRIKASNWTPDIFRNEDFFKADFWLGGAWKAMPGDLSRERLGERVLDLLDDMSNWGVRKYTPGEVDTFKLFNDHEIYGHMNVNYVRLDRLPRYNDGWQPILDALQGGQFFVTTGEVLVKEFTVGGKRSGEVLQNAARPELGAELDWTFPLKFAEVISGDGAKVYRERTELADTEAFGKRTLTLRPDLRGRKWVRFEVWDVAANGAFTMPVWLE